VRETSQTILSSYGFLFFSMYAESPVKSDLPQDLKSWHCTVSSRWYYI